VEVEEKSGMNEWIELQRHQRYSLEHSSESSSNLAGTAGKKKRQEKSTPATPYAETMAENHLHLL